RTCSVGKAGIRQSGDGAVEKWVPAFAGNADFWEIPPEPFGGALQIIDSVNYLDQALVDGLQRTRSSHRLGATVQPLLHAEDRGAGGGVAAEPVLADRGAGAL